MRLKKMQFFYSFLIIGLLGCNSSHESSFASQNIVISNSSLKICSFNIQFLGNSKLRDDDALAQVLRTKACDIVAVQELVAPPDLRLLPASNYYRQERLPTFPGTTQEYLPSNKATSFFMAMQNAGFDGFILSEEDTGPGAQAHTNASSSEWWVAFYNTKKVKPAIDLPHGFLSETRSESKDWDRVPYAFSFRSIQDSFDFVLVSVHLRPGALNADKKRRQLELGNISKWVTKQLRKNKERDYFILGDMNIESPAEFQTAIPKNYMSLNTNASYSTNTNTFTPRPYDHVLYRPNITRSAGKNNNFEVIHLVQEMKKYWTLPVDYPGEPYNHNIFRVYYSDHDPIAFRTQMPEVDND